MIILWWKDKRLTKSYKYIRNDYGLTTVLRLFLKRKLWYYYHGSNEQRVIEKIRLLFFIVNELTCAIIKQINKSRFERRSKMPYITIESGVLTDAQKEQLIKRLTEVSSEIMNVPQEFFSKNKSRSPALIHTCWYSIFFISFYKSQP